MADPTVIFFLTFVFKFKWRIRYGLKIIKLTNVPDDRDVNTFLNMADYSYLTQDSFAVSLPLGYAFIVILFFYTFCWFVKMNKVFHLCSFVSVVCSLVKYAWNLTY